MLTGSGIKIVGEAADAPSTLSLAKKHKPAVVLLDAAIPGGDAFDLVVTLSKTMTATKFVMLSADDNPTYMARARAVGAVNCLLKDVSPKELVTAIETVKEHVQNLLRKLAVRDRTQAAVWALKAGVV